MKYVKSKLANSFPLDKQTYKSLSDADITLVDQMIYRFTKLQDRIGNKLFPQTLRSLGEDYSERPFIDILNRLEKLELIPSPQQWMLMREIRNQLSHEYPAETIEGLNSLFESVKIIENIYTDLRSYLDKRFQV